MREREEKQNCAPRQEESDQSSLGRRTNTQWHWTRMSCDLVPAMLPVGIWVDQPLLCPPPATRGGFTGQECATANQLGGREPSFGNNLLSKRVNGKRDSISHHPQLWTDVCSN